MNTLSGVVTVETFFLCSEKESALKGKNLLSVISQLSPFSGERLCTILVNCLED